MPEEERIRGRYILPKIKDMILLFPGNEKLLGEDTVLLDTAMGYGLDIAQVKLWFPGAEAWGIDLKIDMNNEIKDGFEGDRFTYGRARQVVREALGEDALLRCHVEQGDALNLRFEPDYFKRVLSNGLIHHLPREDRKKSFEEAYRVMQSGGVFAIASGYGVGLDPLMGLKGEYEWDKIKTYTYEGNKRKRIKPKDPDARARFLEDLRKRCRKYGIHPEEHEWRKIEQIAGCPRAFNIRELTPETVCADLKSAGFDASYHIETPGHNVVRFFWAYAKK